MSSERSVCSWVASSPLRRACSCLPSFWSLSFSFLSVATWFCTFFNSACTFLCSISLALICVCRSEPSCLALAIYAVSSCTCACAVCSSPEPADSYWLRSCTLASSWRLVASCCWPRSRSSAWCFSACDCALDCCTDSDSRWAFSACTCACRSASSLERRSTSA